MLFDDALI